MSFEEPEQREGDIGRLGVPCEEGERNGFLSIRDTF